MSEIRWSSKCFHVDTSRSGMKKSMLLSITSVSPEALKITREQFVELGLRHHFVSCRFRLASQPRWKTRAFLEIDMRLNVFGAMNQHIHWKFNDRTSSNISSWNMVHAKMINHFSSSNQPSDQCTSHLLKSRERLDFPQRKAVGGMAQNILVKAGFHQPVGGGGRQCPRGALVGGWILECFRSHRRRQRVKETWRSQWRDCHPARPGMYKTM